MRKTREIETRNVNWRERIRFSKSRKRTHACHGDMEREMRLLGLWPVRPMFFKASKSRGRSVAQTAA
jgi:hypothetical protein